MAGGHQDIKLEINDQKDKGMKEQKFIIDEVKKAFAGKCEKEQIPSY